MELSQVLLLETIQAQKLNLKFEKDQVVLNVRLVNSAKKLASLTQETKKNLMTLYEMNSDSFQKTMCFILFKKKILIQ